MTTMTLTNGHETRTLTNEHTEGSGWLTRCRTSWKGEDGGEAHLAGSNWSASEEEGLKDMNRQATEMKEQGWK